MKKALLSIVIIFFTHNLKGNELFKDYTVQSHTISTPKRGTLKGDFSKLSDRALSPQTGSFRVSLPLEFPSERGSMQYPYSIEYSPAYGISEYGIGWSPRIRINRFRELGNIKFDTTDDLQTPFGQFVKGNDIYYYSKDLKQKTRLIIDNKEIRVFRPDGSVAYFGSNNNDIYTEVHNDGDVHTWFLREVVDPVGKTSLYKYSKFDNEGRVYLTSIYYGGLFDDFQYKIKFDYNANLHSFYSNHLGYKQSHGYRVASISVQSNEEGEFRERFQEKLSYIFNDHSPAFYLVAMQRVYSSGEEMPMRSFKYDDPNEFLQASNWQRDHSLDNLASSYKGILTSSSQVSTVDFNNDGRLDLEIGETYDRYVQTDNGYQTYNIDPPLNETSGRCLFPVVSMRNPRKFFQPFGVNTEKFVYVIYKNGNYGSVEFCKVNGEYIGNLNLPMFWHDPKYTIFSDINNDGKPDLINVSNHSYQIMFNTSENNNLSFNEPTEKKYLKTPNKIHSFWIKDMNGDGIADFVLKADFNLYVYWGDAKGNFEIYPELYSFYLPNGNRNSKNLARDQILFVDANKDGLPDILMQGDAYISLHINTGSSFIQKYVPGIFASPQFFSNLMVADLSGRGVVQLSASIRENGENFIATLDLDRPSLGLMQKMDDGQGNQVEFNFQMSKAQLGVENRKSITSSLSSISTGEGSLTRIMEYGDILLHTSNKTFLGFESFKNIVDQKGESESKYSYTSNNLDQLVEFKEKDYNRPNLIKFKRNVWEERSFMGTQFPLVVESSQGFEDEFGVEKVEIISELTYDSNNLCVEENSKTGNDISLINTTQFSYLPNFEDHLYCFPQSVSIVGSGTDSNFQHGINLIRDNYGRVTSVKTGIGDLSTIQELSYGLNGRIESLSKPGQGSINFYYDSLFRLNKIINPDSTTTEISNFEFINDFPKSIQLTRDSLIVQNFFKFDGFGRLQKEWHNLGMYSVENPFKVYDYLFGDNEKPSRISQSTSIEKLSGEFSTNNLIYLATANGKELASLIDLNSNYKVTGLKKINNQLEEVTHYVDHLMPRAINLNELKVDELNFNSAELSKTKNDIFGNGLYSQIATQASVYQNFDNDMMVLSGFLRSTTIENNLSSLATLNKTNAWGFKNQYTDQEGNTYLYTYDSLGRVRKIQLPNGHLQFVTYEERFGKVLRIDRTDIGSYIYTYNPVTGFVILKTILNKNGTKKYEESYDYDSIGRISHKIMSQFNLDASLKDQIEYTYHYDGENLEENERAGTTGFLTGISGPNFVKKYKYRQDGKLLSESVNIDSEIEIIKKIRYFSHLEISQINVQAKNLVLGNSMANITIDYQYDRFGNISNMLLDNNSFIDLQYNDFNELSNLSVQGEKQINLAYDTTTREARDYSESTSNGSFFQQIIQYNNRGLIEESYYSLNGNINTESYTYDATAWLKEYSRGIDGLEMTYRYSNIGLMEGITKNGQNRNFVIDSTQWVINDEIYELDNFGRVKKKTKLDNTIKEFFYGPNQRISSIQIAGETIANYYYDEVGNPISKNIVQNGNEKEVYWNDMVIVNNVLYMPLKLGSRVIGYFKNNQFMKSSQNHLNTNLIDNNGVVQLSTPFGEKQRNQSLVQDEVNRILDFTLKGYDDHIEAVRMGRRYYDPVAKRFLAPDSYFLENPEKCVRRFTDCNLYSYAINNPLLYTDPTGDAPPLDKDSKITSNFGPRNIKGGASNTHKGADLRASEGSKVFAVADGYVFDVGPPNEGETGGTRVKIKHKDGSYSVSRHIKPIVKKGKVKEGQLIGTTCTGGSCGTNQPHLHFERTTPGSTKPSNPMEFLMKEFKKSGLKLDEK